MNFAPYMIFGCLIILSSASSAMVFKNNTDITDLINNQIKENTVVKIPAGNFQIDAEKSIILKNNVTIEMSPKTILNVIPNNAKSYQVFRIHNVNNVKISGGTILGDKYTHLGNAGEWGMGIEIKDSKNIYISNMNINKMWGDAIYIGSKGKHNNDSIFISNVEMDDNRRQGISVISAENLYVNNVLVSNTGGAAPGSGIDIEPNDNKAILKNLNFNNIQTVNNKGVGIQTTLKYYKGSLEPISIFIDNHMDTGSSFGLLVNGVGANVKGRVSAINTNYKRNKNSNLCFSQWENSSFIIQLEKRNHDKPFHTSRWCKEYKNNKNVRYR
ncbi:right-handed parallel beta-helix repeat-containing protein [Acinetobacter haemolyticus]|uniref:right-handed parallel beta-helix repeat-containing protein n=1 Tax=Acinetobacter haemolyticus TaxID=29430 RepID=UPI003F55F8FF